MRNQAAPQQDIAFGLRPMPPRAVAVSPCGPLAIQVTFADGLGGRVVFEHSHLTGVFRALEDPGYFSQVKVVSGAVTWPDELDLAPDAMYAAIARDGIWILK